MSHDFSRWIFEIDSSDVRDNEVNNTDDDECFCCGKKIKDVKWCIHLLTTGYLISSDQNFDNSQGFFPIGSECKNRLPNNFYFKA